MQLKALLLDLDGTLIDTAPDMVGALNRVLVSHSLPEKEYAEASKLVSSGAAALIRHGFGSSLSEQQHAELVQEFLKSYALHVADQSRVYDGMLDLLVMCESKGIRWGIVTNKPLHLSKALLEKLNLLKRCAILLGGDSLPVKKPDPAPLLHCCMVLNLAPSECLYVGDHFRDIQAGNAAGMDTVAALWGYLEDHHTPDSWKANYLANTPDGLHELLTEKVSRTNSHLYSN